VRLVEIPAEPAAISLDLDRTALLVIDNARSGMRNLLMVGIASNVCVESTIRDAYFPRVLACHGGGRNNAGGGTRDPQRDAIQRAHVLWVGDHGRGGCHRHSIGTPV
jgi:hypothetical protein